MNRIRLLPIVVFAASALLLLKAVGIVSGEGYTLSGAGAVQAQEGSAAAGFSPADLAAADAASQVLFPEGPEPAPGDEQAEADLPELDEMGLRSVAAGSSTGDVLLARLAERRSELDAYADELETRLAMVEAAEMRIEQRMTELSALEAEINARLDAREVADADQFAGVVSMYENMRPADAATIFNDLETGVLVRVGQAMNPRRLGPIIAKMEPVRAQSLTVLLAQPEIPQPAQAAASDFSALPQIMGQ